MEDLVTGGAAGRVDREFWHGRRVLVTGHTGFIGGWLSAWLLALGAEPCGLALDAPTSPSFHDVCGMAERMPAVRADIRSAAAVAEAIAAVRPDIVVHCAAQAIVGVGHAEPAETFATNVLGTVHVLEAIRRGSAKAVVIMTSDKVYAEAHEHSARETDRLGGRGPYAASKACCEFAVDAYAQSYFAAARVGCATVRAGNVIGGGDWAKDRLVPDAVRAFAEERPLELRRPEAVRPWQHVLDAVSGLLLVAQRARRQSSPIGAYNIGPDPGEIICVRDVAGMLAAAWGEGAAIDIRGEAGYPEAAFLALDPRHAREELGWREPWPIAQSIARAIEWYRAALSGRDCWALTLAQIAEYDAARAARGD